MTQNVKPPRPGVLIQLIRQLAADGKVAWSDHAFDERSTERSIRPLDALNVLRFGDIEGKIVAGKKPGEWRCLVRRPVGWSPREVGVATVVMRKDRLLIVTVEWMDR
jgi:hypothetical protein